MFFLRLKIKWPESDEFLENCGGGGFLEEFGTKFWLLARNSDGFGTEIRAGSGNPGVTCPLHLSFILVIILFSLVRKIFTCFRVYLLPQNIPVK